MNIQNDDRHEDHSCDPEQDAIETFVQSLQEGDSHELLAMLDRADVEERTRSIVDDEISPADIGQAVERLLARRALGSAAGARRLVLCPRDIRLNPPTKRRMALAASRPATPASTPPRPAVRTVGAIVSETFTGLLGVDQEDRIYVRSTVTMPESLSIEGSECALHESEFYPGWFTVGDLGAGDLQDFVASGADADGDA